MLPVKKSSINHVVNNLGIFDPPPTPSWSLLLNKAYVLKWSFEYPPPPLLSTWLMNDPKRQEKLLRNRYHKGW